MSQPNAQLNMILGDRAPLPAAKPAAQKNAAQKNAAQKSALNGPAHRDANTRETGTRETGARDAADKTAGQPNPAFRSLMSSLVKARHADNVSNTLAGNALVQKPADILVAPIFSDLPPELQAVLQKLSITELKNVPAEIAALFNQKASPDAAALAEAQAFLDALAAVPAGEPLPPALFELVSDPRLAQFLSGLSTLVHTAPERNISLDAEGLVTVTFNDVPAAKTAQTTLPRGLTPNMLFGMAQDELTYLNNTTTLTIADLDADGFQALKKLAFADIAPYLTQPRTVYAHGNNVMKVAQGPSFLNEGQDNATLLASLAGVNTGLASSLPADVLQNLAALAHQAGVTVNDVLLAAAQARHAAAQTTAQTGILNTVAAPGVAADPKAAADAAPAAAAIIAAATGQAAKSRVMAPAGNVAGNTAPQGFSAQLSGLDHSLMQFDTGFDTDAATGLPVRADMSAPAASTSNLTAVRQAGAAHPATHLVSVTMQRGAESGAPNTERHFVIQLDPPNLGRVKITLEFGENNTVKARLLAERPETVSMLQRDSALLERALANSGVDADNSSLSFDLAQDNAFSGGSQHQGENGGNQGQDEDGTDIATLETVLPIFVDPETGLTHVNIVI